MLQPCVRADIVVRQGRGTEKRSLGQRSCSLVMELSSESVLCLGLFVTLVSGVLMMICGVQICLHMWLMMIRLCSFSGKAGKESAGREKLHGAIECVVVLLQVQQLSTR